MMTCRICHSKNLIVRLDLGPQPVSNRFLKDLQQEEYMYPMVLNQCGACGLIQINDPVPAAELAPAYDWITYSEPEDHLGQLADIIVHLPGIKKDARFCGITFKDNTTLKRLQNRGFKDTWRVDPENDLDIRKAGAGAETIQERLTPEIAAKIVAQRGKSDVVIVRHILEHAHDLSGFIGALKALIHDDGYIVFEVPDCSRALESCDYTTIWEEHTMYFTPVVLHHCLAQAGLSMHRYEFYPYPFENSLVGIAQIQKKTVKVVLPAEVVAAECLRGRVFAENLPGLALKIKNVLSECRKRGEKVAFFGAGHLACTFVSLLGIKGYIDFFVDDNPHKRGLFMPGTRLPVYESAALLREKVKLCLLSLNPLSEEKVLRANQAFLKQGGNFFSIFPASKIALPLYQEMKKEKYNYAH